jgi:hypothetical protein
MPYFPRQEFSKYLGNNKVLLDYLESLKSTPPDIDAVEGDVTVINNQITVINETINNIQGELDGGGLLAPPSPIEPMASTDYPGVVELATQAEVNAGTDTARAITPATLTEGIETAGYWSPLTNGVVATPELVFDLGDTISVWTEL